MRIRIDIPPRRPVFPIWGLQWGKGFVAGACIDCVSRAFSWWRNRAWRFLENVGGGIVE